MELTDNLKHLLNLGYIQDLINNNNWDRLLSIISASYGPESLEILQMCSILRGLERSGTPIELIDIDKKLMYLEKIVLNKDCIFTGITINYGNKNLIKPSQIVPGNIKGINYYLSNINSIKIFSNKQEMFNSLVWEVEVYNVPTIYDFNLQSINPILDIRGDSIKLSIDLD